MGRDEVHLFLQSCGRQEGISVDAGSDAHQ
jgi:hypothetical protein